MRTGASALLERYTNRLAPTKTSHACTGAVQGRHNPWCYKCRPTRNLTRRQAHWLGCAFDILAGNSTRRMLPWNTCTRKTWYVFFTNLSDVRHFLDDFSDNSGGLRGVALVREANLCDRCWIARSKCMFHQFSCSRLQAPPMSAHHELSAFSQHKKLGNGEHSTSTHAPAPSIATLLIAQ